jgi:hypothetical protein
MHRVTSNTMHNQDQSPTTPLHHISARPALDPSQHKRGVTESIVNFVEIVQSAILTLTEAVRIIQQTRPRVRPGVRNKLMFLRSYVHSPLPSRPEPCLVPLLTSGRLTSLLHCHPRMICKMVHRLRYFGI